MGVGAAHYSQGDTQNSAVCHFHVLENLCLSIDYPHWQQPLVTRASEVAQESVSRSTACP